MFCTLTTVVRLTTTLLTTRGPPQPAHDGRSTKRAEPHHGTRGSPQPSAPQLSQTSSGGATKLWTRGVVAPSSTTSSLGAIATADPPATVIVARPERRVMNAVLSGETSTR